MMRDYVILIEHKESKKRHTLNVKGGNKSTLAKTPIAGYRIVKVCDSLDECLDEINILNKKL